MTEDADDRSGDAGSNIPHDLSMRLATEGERSRVDELFDALSHRRRRLVLYYLKANEQTTLDELADWVATIEARPNGSEATAEQREAAAIDLFHIHLPKLADLKVIEYDRRSGDARYRDPPETVDQLLRAAAVMEFE
ncbi:DUF7344 domain-containing protein [Halosolutus gelatinilyticus]|uniref:DUF7344 domain-containing protein n=1 Tax=Halosolutus gelatinilyticus TaxID=2931975 RepID=UPI001FF3AC75|nr:hypothetical protein [Halosolutus gelatinilyticus]